MKFWNNPIFLTQKRLVHRAGVMALLSLVLLVGLSLVAAFIYNATHEQFATRAEWGRVYYAWLLGLQAVLVIIGGFSRISRVLVEERQAGLLDGNRLTPLAPLDLALGYWLGPALREFYAAVALAPLGLAVILMARLPWTLWLGTQWLVFTTALFFGLLAILAGMAMKRSQGGIGLVAMLFLLAYTMAGARFSIFNFLLPVYPVVYLFKPVHTSAFDPDWSSPCGFFGLQISPLVYTFGLQLLLGSLILQGAVRKFRKSFQPAMGRWQAALVFGLLVFLQHGLIWEKWHGAVPHNETGVIRHFEIQMLGIIQVGTLLLGLVFLAARALDPEYARVEALRVGTAARRRTFLRSGLADALLFAVIASVASFSHFLFAWRAEGMRYLLVAANFFMVFLSFSVLLEICRLYSRKKAAGFFMLGLFVLYGLPFLLSAAFGSTVPLKFSFATPGAAVLFNSSAEDFHLYQTALLVHLVVVSGLVWFWRSRWQQWLQQAVASNFSSQ